MGTLTDMTQTQHQPPSGWGAPGGDRWSRRPRRSTTDRKIAGVAGGLGRAIGVDPVLVRVAFVVFTIFGGFGALLYVLGWLLLPADGDQVSAAESLLGRGRSSVPPVLTVGLGILALISVASMFSWGLPFWPLVIGGVIAIIVASKHRGAACAKRSGHGSSGGWGASSAGAPDAANWDERAQRWGEHAGRWGQQAEEWVSRQPWSGAPGPRPARDAEPSSPFDRPAFWDDAGATARAGDPAADGPPAAGERKPPEWDPLGVAPFAWDLPEPAPAPEPLPAQQHRGRSAIGRVTMGLALLAGGIATGGIFAGWWSLTWAGVAATALAVVAAGLLVGSFRGRGHGLIAPGIFLSLVTLALAVTGLDARATFGEQTWRPMTPAAVQSEYVLNGGQALLDLSDITVPAGTTVTTDVEVRAGNARVIVPRDANVEVTCSANAGDITCLGQSQSGLRQELTASNQGSTDEGTIDLTVHVGAGQAEVTYG